MLRMSMLAVVVFAASQPVLAEDMIKGVWLSSEELCAKAKADGIQGVIEEGNILLTQRGLESIEYNCEFVQVTRAARAPSWLVNAVCQEPGLVFPDVLTVTEMTPTQLDIASVRPPDQEEGGSGNEGSYFLCEGVEMP